MRRSATIATSAFRRLARIALAALALACGEQPAPATRVLFIGNSYTYANDLPQTFATLSQAGKHPVVVDMAAEGGWTLAQHLGASETLDKLNARQWDFVLLQEQSVVPAIPAERTAGMYPAVREFTQRIRALHAEPVLFLTWGRRDGLPDAGFPDFPSMQEQLTAGYLAIADELDDRVAPVGVAWQTGVSRDTSLALWDNDGSHPSASGSYLAACVLYATLFHASPVGLPAPAGIATGTARLLQELAQDAVLTDPGRWHLH
ncbi:MAG: hypothetical protein ABSB58_03090 [Gemmatimonadales bacterium]|jgi:hypothetical protein